MIADDQFAAQRFYTLTYTVKNPGESARQLREVYSFLLLVSYSPITDLTEKTDRVKHRETGQSPPDFLIGILHDISMPL